mgnify:CR=1 FL=1
MDTDTNTTDQVKEAKKGGKAGRIAAGVLLSGCLVASLGLNIYQAAVTNQKSGEFIDYIYERITEEEKKENEYIEDGYKVGGEYEIRSTTHISDAYKSGDDSQLSAEDKDTLKMAKKVLDEVLEDGMSDYEKEEAVYKWLVKNIGHGSGGVISRPGMDRSAFTPHDVLTSRSAVCVGYATTFRMFMNMLGMDCHIVHNDYHSWDLVKLDDGWYHVDVYSDAHGVLYGNFNMTDTVAKYGHNWDESALPEAKSVKYSPAVQKAVELDGVTDIPAAMKESLDGKSTTLFYKFKEPVTDEDMGKADFLVNILDTVLNGGLLEDDDGYYFRASWYPSDREDDYILGLLLESHTSDEENGLDMDSPEAKEIIKIVAEAFGIDPAMLGGDPEDGGSPIDGVAGDAVPTQTVVTENGEVITTWDGGGSVELR